MKHLQHNYTASVMHDRTKNGSNGKFGVQKFCQQYYYPRTNFWQTNKIFVTTNNVLFLLCIGVVMRAIAPLLLSLLSALVEVHSQSAPYLTFMGNNITNHSYVDLNTVGSITSRESLRLQCRTDLTTCCSGAQGPDRGHWYFPNGNRLPIYDYNNIPVLSESRGPQRVIVYRHGDSGTSGIYRCDIETIAANNNNGRVSLFVGLYTTGGE